MGHPLAAVDIWVPSSETWRVVWAHCNLETLLRTLSLNFYIENALLHTLESTFESYFLQVQWSSDLQNGRPIVAPQY